MKLSIHSLNSLVACALLLGGLLAGCPIIPDPPTGDKVVLTREHAARFTPGDTISITVEIEVRSDVDITAIGLVETVPEGWTYISAASNSGPLPTLRPSAGSDGTLYFVWITPPRFPSSFTYSLGVPISQDGTQPISGHVEYREGSGSQETTETLTTSVSDS